MIEFLSFWLAHRILFLLLTTMNVDNRYEVSMESVIRRLTTVTMQVALSLTCLLWVGCSSGQLVTKGVRDNAGPGLIEIKIFNTDAKHMAVSIDGVVVVQKQIFVTPGNHSIGYWTPNGDGPVRIIVRQGMAQIDTKSENSTDRTFRSVDFVFNERKKYNLWLKDSESPSIKERE
jgi:hypothetical protein